MNNEFVFYTHLYYKQENGCSLLNRYLLENDKHRFFQLFFFNDGYFHTVSAIYIMSLSRFFFPVITIPTHACIKSLGPMFGHISYILSEYFLRSQVCDQHFAILKQRYKTQRNNENNRIT